jgi:hypothetical protein
MFPVKRLISLRIIVLSGFPIATRTATIGNPGKGLGRGMEA